MWPLVPPSVVSISIFVLMNSFGIGVTAKIMQIMVDDDDYMPGIVFAQLIWPATLMILVGILCVKTIANIGSALEYIKRKWKEVIDNYNKEKLAKIKRQQESPPNTIISPM